MSVHDGVTDLAASTLSQHGSRLQSRYSSTHMDLIADVHMALVQAYEKEPVLKRISMHSIKN